MKLIEFKIVTPEKVIYHDSVESVSLPTVDGEITVLPQHIPLVSAIKSGEMKIKKDGKEQYFSVIRGVVQVDGMKMTLLTDAAERAEEIDEKRAFEAKERAKALMEQKKVGEEGYADAVAHLERALSRLKIAKRKGKGGHAPHIES